MLVLPLEMVVAGGGVVVDTVEGVVVEANIINDYYQGPFLWLSCKKPPVPKRGSIIFYVVSSPQHYIK